jgi:hypothetical protein
MPERCPFAIHFATLTTRCDKPVGHDGPHEGPGLAEFPYQRIEWLQGDRRELINLERDDEHAWETRDG